MSINNLSNDRGGAVPLMPRPSFLPEDGMTPMLNAAARYAALRIQSSDTEGAGGGTLFNGGQSKLDYGSIAKAMLARLEALRERYAGVESKGSDSATKFDLSARLASSAEWRNENKGWWSGGNWYSTTSAPSATAGNGTPVATSTQPAASPNGNTSHQPPVVNPPSGGGSSGSSSAAAPNPIPIAAPPAPASPPAPAPAPVVIGGLPQSNSISLDDGATTIANTVITGSTGIVGDNATHVSALNVSNVTIHSTNYGIYLGSADSVKLSNVDIHTDPNGGDSYSVRGHIRNLVSADSTFNSGIKAFRIYGLEGGSSTRDSYSGDRLMLGGGYSNEWGSAAAFHNFTFSNGSIDVNSVELYDNTNNVVFENMDFSGTGHISIQAGAHDIIFRNCTNLPPIRLYDGNGNWTSPPASSSRNIVITGGS